MCGACKVDADSRQEWKLLYNFIPNSSVEFIKTTEYVLYGGKYT